jgi:hypothetical protein
MATIAYDAVWFTSESLHGRTLEVAAQLGYERSWL